MSLASVTSSIEFGRFKIVPHRRELLADGQPVVLGGRAFDLLMALVEAHGNVLSKDELMKRVWPERIVEESALQIQISALRKALARDRELIRTVSGRGYQFTGDVRGGATAAAIPSLPAPRIPPTNLPEVVSELIGRDAEVRSVTDLLLSHRLITLTGAGGIGKTRLALEVARHLLPSTGDGVWVAELGPVTDSALVPVTVATTLGLTFNADTVSPELVATALGAKRVLLVLDNCEHVIAAAARMSEALLSASSTVCLMATSREPLRIQGEWIYPVPPLEVPAEGTEDTAALLRYSAISLFIARARAAAPDFSPDQGMVEVIGAICRRLDGIPLAIELAAVRAPALGVDALAARLDDRFKLLTGGLRTALPRQRTLRATLDWSYELLTETERLFLSRLAVFTGGFTLESANAVVSSTDIPPAAVVDCVINLVAKSMVSVDAGGSNARYRLLETTRAYAMDKLVESGEFERVARQHAQHLQNVLQRSEPEWETRSREEWLNLYAWQVGNIRAALDWAFSDAGDAVIAVALTVAAVPLWMQLSLLEECGSRVQRALSNLSLGENPDQHHEMQLFAAMGAVLRFTKGDGPELTAIWTKVLELAKSLGEVDYRLRALWALWIDALNSGRFRDSLILAQEFRTFSSSSGKPNDALVGDRLMGYSLNMLGDQTNARLHTERMLSGYAASASLSHIIRFQYDQLVMARYTLAWILWLQGFPDQAMRAAESNIDDPRTTAQAFTLCVALSGSACPISIQSGDFETAERFVAMLIEHSAKHAFGRWSIRGRCFKGMLLIRQGQVAAGLHTLRAALGDLSKSGVALFHAMALGEFALALANAGQISEGSAAIDEAIKRAEVNEELWCLAELLRIKGEIVLLVCAENSDAAADRHFQQSLELARRQGALSWELRCATSLARLWHRQGLTDRAREVLASAYGRFTEGFETADLRAAHTLLEALG